MQLVTLFILNDPFLGAREPFTERERNLQSDKEITEALELITRLEEARSLRRLMGIELSVVPPWIVKGLATASRYDHSIHVAHLSLLAGIKLDLDPTLLSISGLLHDAGCGPFPHISDELMRLLTGREHPNNVRFALEKSSDNELKLIEEFGLSCYEIFRIIEGKHEYSPLINGEMDLDNLDNVYRYIATMPSLPLGEPSYKPSEIFSSLNFSEGRLEVDEDLRNRWERDREKVYNFLENHEGNMTSWIMLSRAMRLLMDEIDEEFLMLTNRKAFSFISSRLPELSVNLLEGGFKLLSNLEASDLGPEIRPLVGRDRADWSKIKEIEDQICSELGLESWCLGMEILASKAKPSRKGDKVWKLYLASIEDDERVRKAWRRNIGLE